MLTDHLDQKPFTYNGNVYTRRHDSLLEGENSFIIEYWIHNLAIPNVFFLVFSKEYI